MNVLLFSGGIDSTVLAWWQKPDRLLFVDYGQVSAPGEERAATPIARDLALPLDIRRVDLRAFGHGVMVGGAALNPDAPEFWPYRNQMLVTMAAMAYADQARLTIAIGTVLGDDVHPDGSPGFRAAMNAVLASQGIATLEAPGAEASTEDLILRSGTPMSVLGWTFSCHTGAWACGQCRGCAKHEQVMSWAEKRERPAK